MNEYYKMIDESKSFEEQINLIRKIGPLYKYWSVRYYDNDNKKLNPKIFKLKIVYISKEIDEMLFEEVFSRINKQTNKYNKQKRKPNNYQQFKKKIKKTLQNR